MKKQKLHSFAKFAALSIIGAFPLMSVSNASAQNGPLPPIVRSDKGTDSSLEGANSKSTPAGLLAPIGSGVKQVAGRSEPTRVARAFSPARMPVQSQANPRSIPAPAVKIQTPPMISPAAPRGFTDFASTTRGIRQEIQAAPVISGSLLNPEATQSVVADPAGSAPNYFDSAPVMDPVPMQSVVDGCVDCGGAGCDACSSGGGAYGPGVSYNPNRINCDYGTYGSVSAARRYFFFEFLYITREDGDITNSNFNPLGEFDFGTGLRITIGQRPDMTQGREISYFGTTDIEARQVTTSDVNRLDALFIPGGALIPDDLSAFFDASRHVQYKESNFHSIEFNRNKWGWDVLKSFIGWRYLYFDDQYQLDSTAPRRDAFGAVIPGAFETGRQRLDTVNHMFGAHIGAELFYDIGYRFSLSGMSKYGIYANINKVDNYLINDGFLILDTEDHGATFASTWEVNLMAHYQIRQTARLRFGYNGLFFSEVATVSDNFTPFVSPLSGFNGTDDDDAYIHGVTAGLEIFR